MLLICIFRPGLLPRSIQTLLLILDTLVLLSIALKLYSSWPEFRPESVDDKSAKFWRWWPLVRPWPSQFCSRLAAVTKGFLWRELCPIYSTTPAVPALLPMDSPRAWFWNNVYIALSALLADGFYIESTTLMMLASKLLTELGQTVLALISARKINYLFIKWFVLPYMALCVIADIVLSYRRFRLIGQGYAATSSRSSSREMLAGRGTMRATTTIKGSKGNGRQTTGTRSRRAAGDDSSVEAMSSSITAWCKSHFVTLLANVRPLSPPHVPRAHADGQNIPLALSTQGHLSDDELPHRQGARPRILGVAPRRALVVDDEDKSSFPSKTVYRAVREVLEHEAKTWDGLVVLDGSTFGDGGSGSDGIGKNLAIKIARPAMSTGPSKNKSPVANMTGDRASSRCSNGSDDNSDNGTSSFSGEEGSPWDWDGEFAHIIIPSSVPSTGTYWHYENSTPYPLIQLVLSPADVGAVIRSGWGERHSLASEGWCWRLWHLVLRFTGCRGKRPVPPTLTTLYPPRNKGELEVVRRILRASVWWASEGTLYSIETEER